MIYTDDICKFHAIITDLKNSGVSVHLYGNSTECFSGAYAGFNTPPNNTLAIHIVALTSVGTIYCNSYTRLKEQEVVENAKQLYDQLSVRNAQVSYSKDSGTVTIK